MKIFLSILTSGFVFITCSAKDLKVLMIGNSFSNCVGFELPKLVAYEKKHNLELTNAYIGSCKLFQHAENLRKAEKDPNFKPYRIDTWISKYQNKKKPYYANVNELLKNNKYDIITIQQGSAHSFDYKFYQPHADELISYIRKYNPQAEIMIQQTWSYRKDSPLLEKFKMSQSQMSEKVMDAYDKFAAATKLRIIPTGKAVEIARRHPNYQFKVMSANELAGYVCPDLPPRSGDVVGKHSWKKGKNGMQLSSDTVHFNEHGLYLQACVWYSLLFAEDAENIKYEAQLASDSCRILRSAAKQAIAEYK